MFRHPEWKLAGQRSQQIKLPPANANDENILKEQIFTDQILRNKLSYITITSWIIIGDLNLASAE